MATQEELIALIAQPSESLTIEHKSWLNLGERRCQATMAKAAIAIANHGGGIIIFGMLGDDAVAGLESHARPNEIARYRQDDINAAINRYADASLLLRDSSHGCGDGQSNPCPTAHQIG